jgi:hypothetical protein
MIRDERYECGSRGSSSLAKKADAAFKISFARRSSWFSRRSRFSSADSSLVDPGRAPASTSACRTHFRTVSPEAPIFAADEVIEESGIEFEGDEVTEEEIESKVSEFKQFLEQVTPDEFAVEPEEEN